MLADESRGRAGHAQCSDTVDELHSAAIQRPRRAGAIVETAGDTLEVLEYQRLSP